MKNNYIFLLQKYISTFFLLLYRRLVFAFSNSNYSNADDFFIIDKDFTFSNSLLKIDFHFSQLLWINFPEVGKKFSNGSITLNSNKLQFPYIITVKLPKGIRKYVIEKENDGLILNSAKYKINYFKSFNILYRKKEMPGRITCLINNKFFFSKSTSSVTLATKIKDINFKHFSKTDYL